MKDDAIAKAFKAGWAYGLGRGLNTRKAHTVEPIISDSESMERALEAYMNSLEGGL